MFKLAQRKARQLLNRLITPNQWKQFILEGFFTQKDGKGRVWKFIEREHYPIECEGQQICIDAERAAPDEDLLAQVFLEVIGGRHQELLPNSTGLHYDYLVYDDIENTQQAFCSTQIFGESFIGVSYVGIDQQMADRGLSGSGLHAQARQTATEVAMLAQQQDYEARRREYELQRELEQFSERDSERE